MILRLVILLQSIEPRSVDTVWNDFRLCVSGGGGGVGKRDVGVDLCLSLPSVIH
ncbi:hypothetical protein E2C01_047537 [Portunus trituberculatus]|uniref:Uncharacterized protein n=1 Tax=Portunus trituberculatus TaxID=210409 RepID=A0A5B7G7R2_PORTR|nr:hypothetical protein [Portunus trituberculatus]